MYLACHMNDFHENREKAMHLIFKLLGFEVPSVGLVRQMFRFQASSGTNSGGWELLKLSSCSGRGLDGSHPHFLLWTLPLPL